eukprot:162940-Amphidinium_carterae.2
MNLQNKAEASWKVMMMMMMMMMVMITIASKRPKTVIKRAQNLWAIVEMKQLFFGGQGAHRQLTM